jgi:pimeloyl-ACP methyl ester carboxylesterase
MTVYYYLHGFTSGPSSSKALFIARKFQELSIPLNLVDFNQPDFTTLTLSRQIEQVARSFPEQEDITVIGSSLGGLTAAWLGEKYPQVKNLILLAPAFGFLPLWLSRLGQETVQEWQKSGFLKVYHYGFREIREINYQFVPDLRSYPEYQLQRPVPTLIIHGKNDEVIPVQHSRDYVRLRPWVDLVELESDHGLLDVLEDIWQIIDHPGNKKG